MAKKGNGDIVSDEAKIERLREPVSMMDVAPAADIAPAPDVVPMKRVVAEYECPRCHVTRFQIVEYGHVVKLEDGTAIERANEVWYVCTSCHDTFQPNHPYPSMSLVERHMAI